MALHPIEPAAALVELGNLLRWYRVAVRVPLPFFRMPVTTAIEHLYKKKFADNDNKVDDGFLPKARHAFEYQRVGTAESTLASVRTAFAGRDPFRMTCGEVPGLEEYAGQNLFLHVVNSICRPMLPYIGSL